VADILDTREAGPAAIRGGVLRVVGYIVGVALTTVSAALLFRHLGVVDSGRYVTVIAVVTIASGLVDFGLVTIGVRELAESDAPQRSAIVSNLIGLRVALSTVGLLGVVAFAILAGYPNEMVVGTLVAGVGAFLAAAQATLGASLMVELRLGWLTMLELLRQALVAVVIVVLVLADAGFVLLTAAPIPAAAIGLGVTAVLVRDHVELRPRFDVPRWRTVLRDMLPFAAATAVTTVYFRASVVLLSSISTAREAGYFAASFRVIEVLLLVPNLIVGAAFPIFARAAAGDPGRLGYATGRVLDACTLVGGLVAVALVSGAPFIIDVVAGPEFGPSSDVLRIQAAALMATFVGATYFYSLLSLHRHAALLILVLGALAVNLALVGVLGSSHGAEGAAVGVLIAEILLVVSGGLVVARSNPPLRPSLRVIPRVLGGIGLGLATVWAIGLPAAAAIFVAPAVYVVVVVITRAVPAELIQEARGVLKMKS
jgi:O-antigen/teichoic acid export membrane protein